MDNYSLFIIHCPFCPYSDYPPENQKSPLFQKGLMRFNLYHKSLAAGFNEGVRGCRSFDKSNINQFMQLHRRR
jgi:hypothetical protein